MKKEQIKTAVGYIRVSTEEQVQGTSLGSQKTALKEFANRNGITLLDKDIFREEGVSAKLIDRPELARMLDHCAKNKGKVIHGVISVVHEHFDVVQDISSKILSLIDSKK